MNRSTALMLALLLCVGPAFGQSADERVAKLRECAQAPTDPSPERRFVALEQIIKGNDRACMERAIQSAMTVNDSKLRGLALGGYLASQGQVNLQIVPPATVRKEMLEALSDPAKRNEIARKTGRLGSFFFMVGGKLSLVFEIDDIIAGRLKVYSVTDSVKKADNFSGPAFIKGSSVAGRFTVYGSSYVCDFEIRPGADGKIVGKATISRDVGQLDVEATMYP